jgi:hypothetical protein
MPAKYNSLDCRSALRALLGRLLAGGRSEFPNSLRRLAVSWVAASRTIGMPLSVHALPAGITTERNDRSPTGLVTPRFGGASWLPPARPRLLSPVPCFRARPPQTDAQES